jgi:hypothetical protein
MVGHKALHYKISNAFALITPNYEIMDEEIDESAVCSERD